jgi:hypothetical protein
LIKRSTDTSADLSLNEIAKAITDRITAPPPNTPPLTAAFKCRKPLFALSEEAFGDITSAPYIISNAREMKSKIIDIFVLIT